MTSAITLWPFIAPRVTAIPQEKDRALQLQMLVTPTVFLRRMEMNSTSTSWTNWRRACQNLWGSVGSILTRYLRSYSSGNRRVPQVAVEQLELHVDPQPFYPWVYPRCLWSCYDQPWGTSLLYHTNCRKQPACPSSKTGALISLIVDRYIESLWDRNVIVHSGSAYLFPILVDTISNPNPVLPSNCCFCWFNPAVKPGELRRSRAWGPISWFCRWDRLDFPSEEIISDHLVLPLA